MRTFVLLLLLLLALLSTTLAARASQWRKKCGRYHESCFKNGAGQCVDSRGVRCGSAQGSIDLLVRQ